MVNGVLDVTFQRSVRKQRLPCRSFASLQEEKENGDVLTETQSCILIRVVAGQTAMRWVRVSGPLVRE